MTDTKELLDYLRKIMFIPNDIPLNGPDLNTSDPILYQLGEGLVYLAKSIECFKSYANELSMGNLSVKFPPKENLFCAPLKNLHANLNHLTWQAQQIAGGDYSQHIDYLGDFSVAFNQMIIQLKDREALLKEYAREKEIQAEQLLGYNELLINLMNGRKEWIFVFNPDTKELLYCNKIPYVLENNDYTDMVNQPQIKYYLNLIKKVGKLLGTQEICDPGNNLSFFINSFHLEWRGMPGIAYIIEDITKEREDEKRLSDLAYKDTFTGIFNRRYLMENVDRLLKIGAAFSFCYIDINHLKKVNDTYGHAEGDKYIMTIVDLIKD
ncbi:MAG: diguanylate cyclase, partial [Clostridiaceae bacterium]|nr:diguanylate cyclase [Clostridiaceae bacterium]